MVQPLRGMTQEPPTANTFGKGSRSAGAIVSSCNRDYAL